MRKGGGLFLLVWALLSGVSSAWAAGSATLERVEGVVELRAVNTLVWAPVTVGQRVQEGGTLRTGTNSFAELRTDRGHGFKVRSETVFELTSLQNDQTLGRLEKGRVLSRVQKLHENETFKIQTPAAVCAVRGTEFDTVAGDKGTLVAVYKGVVGVTSIGSGQETALQAGQMTSITASGIELPRPIPHDQNPNAVNPLAHEARHEVGLDMTRNEIIAAAALEQRQADYVEGKSLVDVEGRRVRLEEYIVRTRADQFKLVALNHRDDQLDYFFYQGTFNKNLPTDLSIALKDLSGKVGTDAPEYYLTAYEMGQSNTRDSIHDTASGGHLVQITRNGSGDYLVTEWDGSALTANTRTITAAELQGDGTYKIYNPLSDSFVIVSAANLAASTQFGVYLPQNDSFRDLTASDTLWKTRYNTYAHALDDVSKISYVKSGATNVLSSALDATWTYAGGFVVPVVEKKPGEVDTTITNYYGDGTFERYRTVLIDDKGQIAPDSAFANISSGAEYKGELLKWNYEQQVEATEFQGRKIDLVVEPKIFIKSGLIQ